MSEDAEATLTAAGVAGEQNSDKQTPWCEEKEWKKNFIG